MHKRLFNQITWSGGSRSLYLGIENVIRAGYMSDEHVVNTYLMVRLINQINTKPSLGSNLVDRK